MCNTHSRTLVPTVRLTAPVTGQRGCMPVTLRSPGLPFGKFQNLGYLNKCPPNFKYSLAQQAVFAYRLN